MNADKKKVTSVLKIVEEWLKNFKSKSLVSSGDDEEGGATGDQEEEKLVEEADSSSPYKLEGFRKLLNKVVDLYFGRAGTQQQQ